jgi:outer membrane protein
MRFFFLILTILLFSSKINAEQNIAFIDLDLIIKNSLVGKSASTQLEKRKKSLIDKLLKVENNLKDEEVKIVSQKNILEDDKYKIKVKELRDSISEHRKNKIEKNNEFNMFTLEANNKILSILNPIINDYSKEKSISIIFQKKNIVSGRNDLDITTDILNLLNNKIKKIDLN